MKPFIISVYLEGQSELLLRLKDFVTDKTGCFSFEKLQTSENISFNYKNEINQMENFEAVWSNESTFEGNNAKVGDFMKLKFSYYSTRLFFNEWRDISLKFKGIVVYINFEDMNEMFMDGFGDLFFKNGEVYYSTCQKVYTDSDGYYIYLANDFQWYYSYPRSIFTKNKINVEKEKIKPIEENLIKVDDPNVFLNKFPMHLFPNPCSAHTNDTILLKTDKVKFHDSVLPFSHPKFDPNKGFEPEGEKTCITVDDLINIITNEGYMYLIFRGMSRQGVEVSEYDLLKKDEVLDYLKKEDASIIDIYSDESKKILHDYLFSGFVFILTYTTDLI